MDCNDYICLFCALRPGRAAGYGRAQTEGAMTMDIQRIGVVGAGQMGNGIAHVLALAGYDVLMTDISQDSLDKARGLIDGNLARQVSRDKITAADKDTAMARISST